MGSRAGIHHSGDLLAPDLDDRRRRAALIAASPTRRRGLQDAAQTAAPALASNAQPFDAVERTMRGAMGGNDPAAVRDAAVAAVRAAITGNPQQADEARARAAETLAKAQNISIEDARAQVRQYEQQYRQGVEATRREATEAAAAATKAVSRGALIGALSLLLGAVAAWFGGRMGAVDPTITASARAGPAAMGLGKAP